MDKKITLLVLFSVLLFSAVLGTGVVERGANVANLGDSGQLVSSGLGQSGNVDWWPIFHHDLRHTGYSTSKAPKTNQTLWVYTTSNFVTSSPAVVDGVVFVGSGDGKVYALNATTGAQIWNYTTGQIAFSSPAVADDMVFIGSMSHKIYALNKTTGAFIWSYATPFDVWSSPAVANGMVFIGLMKGDSNDGQVVALNATTGTLVWSYLNREEVFSSPAVVDGVVFVGGNFYAKPGLLALNQTTGALIWFYETGGMVRSSPAVVDGVVFVGSGDGKVYALNATTGAQIWNYTTGSYVYSSPAVHNSRVYIGSNDGKIYCFGTHDVSIVNISLSATNVYTGETVDINVTVDNEGTPFNETFDVNAYYDSVLIGTLTVTNLAEGAEATLTFSWNTTGVAGGYYTISADLTVVPGETDTADNNLTDGTVKVVSPVRIVDVTPCNQTGYLQNTFELGTIAYLKVTINSTALIPQDTLITINLFDNITVTIGVASFQGPILSGTSTIIFGIPIPTTATMGTATAYANCYTDWPSEGGFPHCPEKSATFEITGP